MSTQANPTQFAFDPKLYRAWIEAKCDPEDYRRFGGLSERDAADEIDGLFADAREAGAVTPPAKHPGLEVDARASRASVVILLSDRTSDHPSVASHPIEVREAVDRDGGGADEALDIVRFLVDHANALLEEASGWLMHDNESPDLAVVVKEAFTATLRQRGADLAADRLSLLDPDQAWDAYFGPASDRIEDTLAP